MVCVCLCVCVCVCGVRMERVMGVGGGGVISFVWFVCIFQATKNIKIKAVT